MSLVSTSLDLNRWADIVTSIRLDKVIKVWICGCLWCNCMCIGGIGSGRHHHWSTRTLYCWRGWCCKWRRCIPAWLIWPTHSVLIVSSCRMLWRRSINHGCNKGWWCCSGSSVGTIIWTTISRSCWWTRWTISFIWIFTSSWWCWRWSIIIL